MSLALGILSHIPASLTVACQLFVASPPAVGWYPHFGEENYVFGQNTRQLYQQYNDLAYCGVFSNIDASRVLAAWTVPPPAPPDDLPLETNIAIGDRLAEENFEQLRRFGIFHQNVATMPPEYGTPRGPVAELPERKPPPLPRPRPVPSERVLVSALVDAEEREAWRLAASGVREECAQRPFDIFLTLFAPRCAVFPDWY